MYVEASNLKTQENLDTIANWTTQNLMKLNEEQCKYMLFSRSETEVTTRLTLNNNTLERIEETKLVGVWITTWLDWEKNTREICKKAYARMTILTKLKYAGVPAQDLITVYILFIRSLLEYCSVAWHSTLTGEQNQNLERVQKLCLKVILGEHYKDYSSALDTCGLDSLSDRREDKCLQYGLKSLLHPVHSRKFPVNPHIENNSHDIKNSENFKVNWAKTDSYRMSAIPYIQRKLNDYVRKQTKK